MKTIPEILDIVKKKAGIKNDYNLGLKIGISTGAMFEFRHGKSIPSDDTCIKLANLAGEDAEKIILIAHASRAESKEATKIWNGILKKAIGFSIVIILISPTLFYTLSAQQSIYYATWWIATLLSLIVITPIIINKIKELWKWKRLKLKLT